MNAQDIIALTASHVKEQMQGDSTGHDWWHVYRVWKNAIQIARSETADLQVVELAALLHDIADWKFHNGDSTAGSRVAREWLQKCGLPQSELERVCDIVEGVSFKGANVKTEAMSIEGMIVQDADRLDALGAIGIARAFAYGGKDNRELYNPNSEPVFHSTPNEYRQSKGSTINHFYEKLLLLKDRMNTEAGKRLAQHRHSYMEAYLNRFLSEFEGRDLAENR